MKNWFSRFTLSLSLIGFTTTASLGNPGKISADVQSIRPVLIGQIIPDAIVTGLDGKERQLKQIVTEKPTVLVVFRGGWCPFCSLQLEQLSQIQGALDKSGWQIVGLSADPASKMAKATKKESLSYQLFSDESARATSALGLAYKATIDAFGSQTKLKKWLADRDPKLKGTPAALPVPAVYLIHRSGLVVYQYVNIDYSVRLSGEVLLTAAQAYSDEG
jgi:peroxiredoxin